MKEPFRYKLIRFMQGRYGNDNLSKFLTFVCFVVLIISLFVRQPWLSGIFLVIIIIVYFRMFSKNITKRSKENQIYLKLTAKIRGALGSFGGKINQSKDYKIFKCPNCGQKLRVPRHRGKILITCKKCDYKFNKKS